MQVKYFVVKTVDGRIVQVTEKKATQRDTSGRFTGKKGGRCRWFDQCPFRG